MELGCVDVPDLPFTPRAGSVLSKKLRSTNTYPHFPWSQSPPSLGQADSVFLLLPGFLSGFCALPGFVFALELLCLKGIACLCRESSVHVP